MKLIIFQKLTHNHIYFFYYLIFSVIQAILELYISKEYAKISKDNGGHFYYILVLIFIFLSDFLSLIPFFIKKCLTNNKAKTIIDENKNDLRNNNDYIYNNAYKEEIIKKSKNLKILTFMVGFTDSLSKIIYFLCFYYYTVENLDFFSLFSSEVVIRIVLQYILSVIILKTYFYKHHYLSIIINVISLISLSIFDIKYGNYSLLQSLFYIIYIVCLAFENTYGKKAMIYGFLSPFNLLITRGVYKIILLIIFLVIFIPIQISIDNNFFDDINVFSGIIILFTFLYFISYFLKDLFNFILIDRFSPNHLALSLLLENIGYLISFIINYSINEEKHYELWIIVIRIFIHIILFIAALIHNEIFIITKWGLGESTKLFMDEKVKEEMLLSNPDIDKNVLKRYDSMIDSEQSIINDEKKIRMIIVLN